MNLFVTVCMSLCVLSVVFNVYGPRAVADDADRIEFKHRFYGVLEMGVSSASRKEGICCWGSQHCSFCYGSM
jgi:hypothetical protein